MALTITSWNMQGAGYNKLTTMCNVYNDFKDTNIFLLQETGNPYSENGIQPNKEYTIFGKKFICVAACEDETAKAKRCTTAILLDEIRCRRFDRCYQIEKTGYRPAIVAQFDDCDVATIHAPAVGKGDLPFLKSIYAKLNYNSESCSKPWILMGDMNVNLSEGFPFALCDSSKKARPDTLNEIWIDTSSRYDVRCFVMFPEKNTQGSNGNRTQKLDFAFLSSRLKGIPISEFYNKMVRKSVTGGECLSDHNMIGIVLY